MNALPLLNLGTKLASLVGIVAIIMTFVSILAIGALSGTDSVADAMGAAIFLASAAVWAAIALIAIIGRRFIFKALIEVAQMQESAATNIPN